MTSTRARSAITVTGLRKSFGDKVVLDGIDLDVAEGTTFSLLGPNGAGKTTVVRILSTLIGSDGGRSSRPAPRTNSNAVSPAATCGFASVTRPVSTRRPALSAGRPVTTMPSPCRFRATAASRRCEHSAIEVDGVSVHTPDLDDVFFALTGHPTTTTEKTR